MYLIFLFADGSRTSVRACDAEDALSTMHATLARNDIREASYRIGRNEDRVLCEIPAPAPATFELALCVDLGRMA
jgi:hypothetical protein